MPAPQYPGKSGARIQNGVSMAPNGSISKVKLLYILASDILKKKIGI